MLRTTPKFLELKQQFVQADSIVSGLQLDVDYSKSVMDDIIALDSFSALTALSEKSSALLEALLRDEQEAPPAVNTPRQSMPSLSNISQTRISANDGRVSLPDLATTSTIVNE